jgi:glutaredoxin
MNMIKSIILIFGFCVVSSSSWAVKVYECEDEQGNRTFQSQCPPGSTPVNEKNYSTGGGSSGDEDEVTELVLYRVSNCHLCDQIKEFVSEKNLSLTEKDVESDFDLQQELKSKNNGQLRVPVLLVGEKAITGFNPEELTAALAGAGYIPEPVESETE